jgi:ABC-type transport system substrate-binding protein
VKFHGGTVMTVADVVFSINNTYGGGSEPFAASGTIASVVAIRISFPAACASAP